MTLKQQAREEFNKQFCSQEERERLAEEIQLKNIHKHNWVFVGNYFWKNGLGQTIDSCKKKFICPDCEEEKYVDD